MSRDVRDRFDALILGSGQMGTALAVLAARRGRQVALWVRDEDKARQMAERRLNERSLPGVELPESIEITTDLSEAVRGTPLVIMAVPSRAFRSVARTLGDDLEGDQNVVHVTKGFEIETFSRMSQVLREETCTLKVGVLSGPTVATELAAGQPSGAVLASKFGEVVERTQALFDGTTFRVYGGHDIVGVEVAGAFKELVAVAAGAVDGLGLGQSTKWLVVTRGLREMAALGVAMGADVFTFGGLAGVGELGAACSSDRSLGHRLGRLLAEGNVTVAEALEKMPGFVEALPTSEAVQRHSTRFGVDLPIARAVYDLLHGERPVRQCVDDLMSIPVGQEMAALKLS